MIMITQQFLLVEEILIKSVFIVEEVNLKSMAIWIGTWNLAYIVFNEKMNSELKIGMIRK